MKNFKPSATSPNSKNGAALSGWLNLAVEGPSSSSPPASDSGPDLARPHSSSWATKKAVLDINAVPPPEPNTIQFEGTGDPPSLCLDPSPSLVPPSCTAENPSHPLQFTAPESSRGNTLPSAMAYQRADPRPFVPVGFDWVDLPNRAYVSRAVAPTRPPATNEDLAIATFNPIPGNQLSFPVVRDIIREFLAVHRIEHRVVMPTHLGQAMVRFNHAYDRDNFVRRSPLPCGNVQISITKHNQGRNWRRTFYNVDCWMMLLGFPDDYKNERHIQNAISEFRKVILWEESSLFPSRLMVRAWVNDVEQVPQFLVYADPFDLNGQSWTIQCEVMIHHEEQQGPPVEEPVPDEMELEPVIPFDFFGLGQPLQQQQQQNGQAGNGIGMEQTGNGNENINEQAENEEGQAEMGHQHADIEHQQQVQPGNVVQDLNFGLDLQLQQNNPWEPWPDWPAEPQVQQLAQPAQGVQDLNWAPQDQDLNQMEIDLNALVPLDPLEVIIHPANPLEGFI